MCEIEINAVWFETSIQLWKLEEVGCSKQQIWWEMKKFTYQGNEGEGGENLKH